MDDAAEEAYRWQVVANQEAAAAVGRRRVEKLHGRWTLPSGKLHRTGEITEIS